MLCFYMSRLKKLHKKVDLRRTYFSAFSPIEGTILEKKSSESNLRVKFKDYMGISPNEYRTKSRIEKAKNLLATSQMSVKEITYLLGFYDESYFYKVFKTETGITPKEYRNTN